MAPNRETMRLLELERAMLAAVTDAQARAVTGAWVRAWDEISVEMNRTITAMMEAAQSGKSTVSQARRLRMSRRALAVASTQLEELCAASGVRVSRDLARVIRLGAEGQVNLINSQLPGSAAARFDRVDVRQLDAMVNRTTQQITARHLFLSAEATEVMRRELTRTIAVGDNPRVAARRMVSRVRDGFDGGLPRAMTIARTEQLDAYRAAGKVSQDANADVLKGWRWVADFSERTCRSCLSMDGTEFPLSVDGPIDHHQGRCSRVPITKSWADLGFDGIDEPAAITQDAEEWLTSQPESVQRRILTNRGYDEWKAGNYPRDAWTTRRSTDGWRDAQVPSIPPRRGGGGGGLSPSPVDVMSMRGADIDDEIAALMEAGDYDSPRMMSLADELDRRETPSRRHAFDDARDEEEARAQFLAETGRKRWTRAPGTGTARDAHRAEWELLVESSYLEAEAAVNGVFLSRLGQAAGIDPRDFFTAKITATKWMSEELQQWFARHPRMSLTQYIEGRVHTERGEWW